VAGRDWNDSRRIARAVIRTLITCVVALALAFSGSRWQRTELIWIAYGTLALVTAKLLFEDLQHGHPDPRRVDLPVRGDFDSRSSHGAGRAPACHGL